MDSFVSFLERLGPSGLKVLERSLRQYPEVNIAAAPYLEPFLSVRSSGRRRRSVYLVAGLYALHRRHERHRKNLGYSLGLVGSERTRLLLGQLTTCDELHLKPYLIRAFRALDDVPIDFVQLLTDLHHWPVPSRNVPHRWINAYTKTIEEKCEEEK